MGHRRSNEDGKNNALVKCRLILRAWHLKKPMLSHHATTDGHPERIYRCAGGLGSHFLFNVYKRVLEGGVVPTHLAASKTVFIPKSSTVHDNGVIVKSSDALRPLTLCICECKMITTTICFGLHGYSIRYIHAAQRCISSRQMTDNIFEVEMTALAHVTCGTCDLYSVEDFAAAYPVVNHTKIFPHPR